MLNKLTTSSFWKLLLLTAKFNVTWILNLKHYMCSSRKSKIPRYTHTPMCKITCTHIPMIWFYGRKLTHWWDYATWWIEGNANLFIPQKINYAIELCYLPMQYKMPYVKPQKCTTSWNIGMWLWKWKNKDLKRDKIWHVCT